MLTIIKKIVSPLLPVYHLCFAKFASLYYKYPQNKIIIIGVTGTKGKTTIVELLNAFFEAGGYKTALSSTLRFKIGDKSEPNLKKMSMPGRGFIQKFLCEAHKNNCAFAIIEMTSEGAKQFRHKFINLDAVIFSNLAREHIESHGSYEKYRSAKLAIIKTLEQSPKTKKILVVNGDDKEAKLFLDFNVPTKKNFKLSDFEPYTTTEDGITFTYKNETFTSPLRGKFNIYNIVSAVLCSEYFGVSHEIIKRTLKHFAGVSGRVEHINAGQSFKVIVDYAHTAESLTALYSAFPNNNKICVLGATGGGRDKWKRKLMGNIADNNCDKIILTDEDPYDENPQKIVNDVLHGITKTEVKIIMDRRSAMREAFKIANNNDVVLITGKGTDPYIMGAKGKKTPWSDALVAKEELMRFQKKSNLE